MRLRSPFFWDIAHCHSVFGTRRVETAFPSHLQVSKFAVDVEISTLEEETINSMVKSVLIYGAETWSLYEGGELTELRWMYADDQQGFLN